VTPRNPVRRQPTATETLLDVTADVPGERLDVAVARLCDISRAQAHRLIEEGLVSSTDGPKRKSGEKLAGGEQLRIVVPAPAPAEPQPEAVPLSILFEDEHLLVVDKPAGMPVHPGPGHSGKTLVNALLAHCLDLPGIGGVQRPGIVHRLDKDTSGLMVVAKTERAHAGLSAQLKDREMRKTYVALVEGRVQPVEAMIDAPVGRDTRNRRRMAIDGAGAREAQTSYRTLAKYESLTLVEATLHTGRTHQIRIHFASLGHPLAGDTLYGKASKLVPRQFLHAHRLAFRHPIDGQELSFEAPLPEDLALALQQLER
jgi:23S rRNA pseudouridine1911/1915/1917 synthase